MNRAFEKSFSPEFHWDSGPSIFVTFKVQNAQITRVTLAPSQAFGCTIQGKVTLQEEILSWIEGYLKGKEDQMLPLDFSLFTPFMQAGIEAIRSIPFGKVATYGAVAKNTSNPHCNPRALGNVCHRNPYPLVIPCHRVVASNCLGGFAYGPKIKQELLRFESLISFSS